MKFLPHKSALQFHLQVCHCFTTVTEDIGLISEVEKQFFFCLFVGVGWEEVRSCGPLQQPPTLMREGGMEVETDSAGDSHHHCWNVIFF